MLNGSGKIEVYLRIGALLLLFFCGYSLAQGIDSTLAPEPVTPVAPPVQPVSLDSIPKGFASQLQKSQPPPVEEPPVEEPPPAPVEVPSSSSVVSSSSAAAVAWKSYEDYLDSVVVFAKNVLPGKQNLETQKALINEKTPEPKGEYEKQSDYDKRIANFNLEKQEEIRVLEKKYKEDEKNRMEKLRATINYKPDIQPEWAGILKQDTTPEGYNERTAMLSDKISFMRTKTANAMETLTGLDLLGKDDLETLDKKNSVYMARLERAHELMQDYILQDYARVISTERKKFDMVLGAYDPEKEQFQVNMSDVNSRTVPFNYVGFIKISPATAQVIDRKTDDFLASIDYINYPFVVNGEKSYPGAKKADIYYKDNAVQGTGVFQNVPGFENLDGYIEWAVRADSLISGKLVPRKLDSLYAMKKELPKAGPTGTWWQRNKNIVRGTFIALTAAGAGVAVWQDSEAKDKTKKLNRNDWYGKTVQAVADQNKAEYNKNSEKYNDGVKDVHFHQNMRNGFYIGAGVLGFAGILSFCF